MEHTMAFKCAQHAVPSPGGTLVAYTTTSSTLEIRKTASLHTIRSIVLPQRFNSAFIRWSPSSDNLCKSSRIAVFNEHGAYVVNISGQESSATINRGSGGMGKIVNAEFGRSDDEFVVFADFGSKVTIWNLVSGRSIDIKDPKFCTPQGFAYRPGSTQFLLLSRQGPHDIMTLHTTKSGTVIWRVTAVTMDAQGMRWSPDGKLVAIWDSPSAGYNLHVYTASGHRYRTYTSGAKEDIELGIKAVEWSPSGEILAVSGYNTRVTVLSTRTFSPLMFLDHVTPVLLPSGSVVLQEQVSGSTTRTYTAIKHQAHPPTNQAYHSSANALPDTAISLISFSRDGNYLATRYDHTPTTAWIWDIRKVIASAVLIQHAPIKQLSWHPSISSLLFIQCIQEDYALHFFNAATSTPTVFNLPLSPASGRPESRRTCWLPAATSGGNKAALLVSDSKSFLVVHPFGKEHEDLSVVEEESDIDGSLDSVYQVLTGRSPFRGGPTELLVSDVVDDSCEVDDTFQGRHQLSSMA